MTIPDPFAVPLTADASVTEPGPVAMAPHESLDLPEVPEGGDLQQMQTLAQQLDWPVLFIEAVPPDLMKKFRTYAKGKTDLERLQDLIRQVEYE